MIRDDGLGARVMALIRVLDFAQLPEAGRELRYRALHPDAANTTSVRHLRTAEYEIRRHLRGEPGPHIEKAIARLICATMIAKLQAPVEGADVARMDAE